MKEDQWRLIASLLRGKKEDIQVPLLIDPSPFGARSVFDPFKQVAFIDRDPPGVLQRLHLELESVYSSEIPITKTTASGIDRVIGGDIEKGILIYVAHHWSFALPVISRVLNNAKRIDPEPSNYSN